MRGRPYVSKETRRRVFRILKTLRSAYGIAIAGSCITVAPAHALPSGRTWSTPVRLVSGSLDQIVALDLLPDASGAPSVLALGRSRNDPPGRPRWWRLAWAESAWSTPESIPGAFGEGPAPVVARTADRFRLWIEPRDQDPLASPLLIARWPGIAPPETVAHTSPQASGFAGAAVSGRRWVIRSQQRDARTPGFAVRTWTSDRTNRWAELPALGRDEFTCAIAPLSTRSAIAAFAGQSGLGWAIADGAAWARQGVLDPRPWVAQHPRFAQRQGGGAWLAWTDKGSVHVATFDGSAWQPPDSFTCVHPAGQTFWPSWCDVSPGDLPPVVAWGDRGHDRTRRDCLCVAIPDSATWGSGEEVPGSDGAYVPAVMRDGFGETWVAWVRDRSADAWIVHTRVVATAESLVATVPETGRPCLSWRWTVAAPGSVWSVWRAIGATWTKAGEVVAGQDPHGSWCDFRARDVAESVRYRLQREAVDERERWRSPEVSAR